MDNNQEDKAEKEMPPSYKVIIVGAGIGGLVAGIALSKKGHKVTILEAASQLGEVGAGIQVPPNSTKILKYLGIFDRFKDVVVWPRQINLKRWKNGEILSTAPLDPEMTQVYGTPYWLIHRPDYHNLLHEAALENGCEIRVKSRVISVDESAPSITLKTGETLKADVIVGADGIKSVVRSYSIEQKVGPRTYGECAYRATVPAELILSDPELAHFIKEPVANCWIGPGRHLMAYPIQHSTKYNLVMVHPGVASQDRWNEPGDLEEMVGNFAEWDPLLVRVLKKIKDCLKWNLADLPLLDTWQSKSGKVVLIGDACHATLPFLAQGAAMAVEDGLVLAECISRATIPQAIPLYLTAFESIRKERTFAVQSGSVKNMDFWHMEDSARQRARDAYMKGIELDEATKEELKAEGKNPNQWADPSFQQWLFGYDALAEANRTLDKLEGKAKETAPSRSGEQSAPLKTVTVN